MDHPNEEPEKASQIAQPLQLLEEGDFRRILENSPGHCLVYNTRGDLVYLTPATQRLFHIKDLNQVLGQVNVLKDPSLSYAGLDMRGIFQRAMARERFNLYNVRTPVREITERFGSGEPERLSEFTTFYVFPLYDQAGQVSHVVTMMMPQQFFKGDPLALACREYLEEHWQEPFDNLALARRVAMSRSQVNKVFENAFGLTPFAYYRRKKIDHLKEALLQPGVSVKQAYTACGLTYNGSLARDFANSTGYTPKAFQYLQRDA